MLCATDISTAYLSPAVRRTTQMTPPGRPSPTPTGPHRPCPQGGHGLNRSL